MLRVEYSVESEGREDHWVLKMKPEGAEEPYSFHFIPLQDQKNIFVHIKDNGEIGPATLQFSGNGNSLFSDPSVAIKNLVLLKR